MSKEVFISEKHSNMRPTILSFVKAMYYFGYLPFSWLERGESEFFKINAKKTLIIFLFDLLLALMVPLYFYLWHLLNITENFEMSLLLKPSYYTELNDGVITTTLSQLVYVAFVSIGFWAFSFVGEYMNL
jgi:hypothetical protein